MPEKLARLNPENAVLLVVDLQDRLLPAIFEAEACVEACRRMIAAARLFELPILLTEQYPQGLGRTCRTIQQALGDCKPVEKTLFSACVPDITDQLQTLDRSLVVVVGIETHVCVQQTVLDLLRLGYTPYVCADAVGSRRPLDRETALGRMRQAGAVVTTTESATFELLGRAEGDAIKQVLKIVK